MENYDKFQNAVLIREKFRPQSNKKGL